MNAQGLNAQGTVRKIITMSSVDGPGNRYSIFLQGCNINCKYCHNPETIPFGKADQDIKIMSVGEIVEDFKKYQDFVAGVSVSGGEATCQIDFLRDLCEAFKAMNVDVLIDTNGTMATSKLEKIIPFIQGFMLDIKAVDNGEHSLLTGVGNTQILANFNWMLSIGKLVEVRTVVVPNMLSNEKTVDYVAKALSDVDPSIRYKIIAYRPHGVRKDLIDESTPSKDTMKTLEKLALAYGLSNVIIV